MYDPILRTLSGTLIVSSILVSPSRAQAEEQIVPMREVSVFDLEAFQEFQHGAYGRFRPRADPEVKAYPALRSRAAVYGSVVLGDDPKAPPIRFVMDESRGYSTGYDLLYLDLDRDLDLTDDKPLRPNPNAPERAKRKRFGRSHVCFSTIRVAGAPGSPMRSVEVMPRLMVSQEGYKRLDFIGTEVWHGRFTVGSQDYEAVLGHRLAVRSRFDGPRTSFYVYPQGKFGRRAYWWGGDQLNSLHRLEGTLFQFAATPRGDKLTIRPYAGDYGTFAVGAGGRTIEKVSVGGSFRGRESAVALEADGPRGSSPIRECQLPVGDYLPSYINVRMGNLRLSISNNYHADGKPRGRDRDSRVYGIQIRKDKPFTLDFSRKPSVLFASPAKGAKLHPGDTLTVNAVLIDPVLDIMIRGLDRTKANGRRGSSLDPKVIVTRENGEKMAEGVMPFG